MPTAPRARFRPSSAAAWRTWSRPRRELPGLVLLLALAACGGRPSAPTPRAILLSDADVHDVAALLRLEDRRELDTQALGALTRSATPEVRRRAFLAAGRIGGAGAAELVRPGLRDSVQSVRAAAAEALGLLRDTASVDSLNALAMRAGAGEAAQQAVFALGRMNTATAHRLLAGLLQAATGFSTVREGNREIHYDSPAPSFIGPNAGVSGQALLALWRFPRSADDWRLAAEFAFRPDTALRWRATYALMRLGDPASVPALLRLMADPYPEVRALAARALRAPLADSAGQRAAAQSALLRALADAQPHVRINALNALAGYRAPETIAAMAALLHDADPNVQLAAAGALAADGAAAAGQGSPALAPLRALVADADRPLSVRAAALAALVRLDPQSGVPAAQLWATAATDGPAPVVVPQALAAPHVIDAHRTSTPLSITLQVTHGPSRVLAPAPPRWRTRYYAASALGAGRWADVSAPLLALARDPDPRVAAAALDAMTRMFGDTLAPPRALLVEKLADPDPIVRASALAVLGARVEPGNLDLYLDSYARAAADTMDDAARAAVDAIAAIARREDSAMRAFFARFRRSADPVVWHDVAQKLGPGWGPLPALETGRAPAFYEDVVRRFLVPALALAPAPRVRLVTTLAGTPDTASLLLELDAARAPLTVANFVSLADMHYFDANRWHRVVPNFVVQDGDPRGDGNGGPGWVIRDELSSAPYLRGVLGMALSGPDTGGSQFFLTLSPQPHLDAGYTVFGRVAQGMDVVDRILQDDLIRQVEVVR